MDRRNLVNLSAAIAAITVFGFTLGLMFPLLSLIMEKRGISSAMIGYNAAMQPVGIVLAVFAIPGLVRRFGARAAVIGAALVAAAVVLAYPFLPVFWWWFALRILQGFCVSILFAVSEAWVVRFAEGPYRSRLLALYVSVLAASFGGGPIIIGIIGIDGLLPFLIGAAILVLATIPIFFLRDDAIEGGGEDPLSLLGFASKAPILLAAVGIYAIIDAAYLGFLPVYGVKKGMGQEIAALVLTAFIIGNTVLQFPVGWLADHFPKRLVMAGCGIVTAAACALMPAAFDTWVFWVLLPVGGAASAGIYTVALAELGDRFSGHELVTGTASFATIWGLGAILGALLAGWSIEVFGPDGLPYTLAIVFAIFLSAAFANGTRKRA